MKNIIILSILKCIDIFILLIYFIFSLSFPLVKNVDKYFAILLSHAIIKKTLKNILMKMMYVINIYLKRY